MLYLPSRGSGELLGGGRAVRAVCTLAASPTGGDRLGATHRVDRGLSSRRAYAVLSVARSTLGYVSRLRQRDAPALAVVRELAGQYPRYGYRKIRVFLARRGHPMSAQRAYRLWHQAGLQVPRRRPRRRGLVARLLLRQLACLQARVNTVSVIQRLKLSLSMNCLNSSASSLMSAVMTRVSALPCSMRALS